MSCKILRIGTPKIEQIEDKCFVDWHYKKVITKGLARGTHYASYYDRDCKVFSFWLTREHVKSIKVKNTAINNTLIE